MSIGLVGRDFDTDCIPSNIKLGVEIDGVVGTMTGIDGVDLTATQGSWTDGGGHTLYRLQQDKLYFITQVIAGAQTSVVSDDATTLAKLALILGITIDQVLHSTVCGYAQSWNGVQFDIYPVKMGVVLAIKAV